MTSTLYLLSLADLHSAASGVLDVIFGPDGDFEDAPPWAGPMLLVQSAPVPGGIMFPGGYLVSIDPACRRPDGFWFTDRGPMIPWASLALDLRIPSSAARIAALIQQVGGDTGDDMIAESVVNSLDNPRAIAELAPALAAHFRDPIILARIAALRRTP